ncbi:hypothetical protein BHE74_00025612 [Ensete ventricosum]|nr:hypothetical protein BHE74_00025612 [Ensete ventricosum]RZS03941.1 hypothetical protein BHM03_00034199 [Ensete ventricosum]
MLMEDGSQGDLDHEAAATVEEEESSSNAGRASTVMLQVRRGCDGVISKWLLCCWRMATEGSGSRGSGGCSKGAAATEGRRAAECLTEEGSSDVERETAAGNLRNEGSLLAVNKEDGSERLLLAALVQQEIAAGCDQFDASRDQGRSQRKIAAGSVCAARERCWLRWQREIAAGSFVQREIASGYDQGGW